MGSASWLLAGDGSTAALCSACHGAGRAIARGAARHVDAASWTAAMGRLRVVTPVDVDDPVVRRRRDVMTRHEDRLKEEGAMGLQRRHAGRRHGRAGRRRAPCRTPPAAADRKGLASRTPRRGSVRPRRARRRVRRGPARAGRAGRERGALAAAPSPGTTASLPSEPGPVPTFGASCTCRWSRTRSTRSATKRTPFRSSKQAFGPGHLHPGSRSEAGAGGTGAAKSALISCISGSGFRAHLSRCARSSTGSISA
jgi:hypothetical protein